MISTTIHIQYFVIKINLYAVWHIIYSFIATFLFVFSRVSCMFNVDPCRHQIICVEMSLSVVCCDMSIYEHVDDSNVIRLSSKHAIE